RVVEVVEVVEHDDPVAPGEAPVREVRADEAGSARDQDLHCGGAGVGEAAGSAVCVRTYELYSFRMPDFCRSAISQRRIADSLTPTTRRFAASYSSGSLTSLPAVPWPSSSFREIESRCCERLRRLPVKAFPNSWSCRRIGIAPWPFSRLSTTRVSPAA